MPIRLPSLLDPERVVVWAAEVVRGLEVTLSNFDRLKQTRGAIVVLAPYYLAELPRPDPPWQMLMLVDDAGGPAPVYSDGSSWKRVSDNTTVVP